MCIYIYMYIYIYIDSFGTFTQWFYHFLWVNWGSIYASDDAWTCALLIRNPKQVWRSLYIYIYVFNDNFFWCCWRCLVAKEWYYLSFFLPFRTCNSQLSWPKKYAKVNQQNCLFGPVILVFICTAMDRFLQQLVLFFSYLQMIIITFGWT